MLIKSEGVFIFVNRCLDLENYAAEQKCKCILLLNKADLTTEYVRKCWAEYFTKEVTMFSSKLHYISFIYEILIRI